MNTQYEVGISDFNTYSFGIEHPKNEGTAIMTYREKIKYVEVVKDRYTFRSKSNYNPVDGTYAYLYPPTAYLQRRREATAREKAFGLEYVVEFYDLETDTWSIPKRVHGIPLKPEKKK